MNKTDREFHEINNRVSLLVMEACDLGRRLNDKENRDVVIWLGWNAMIPALAEAKVGDLQNLRAEKTANASKVGKLAQAFVQAIHPGPFADNAAIQKQVRADVVAKFNAGVVPPAEGIEAAKQKMFYALEREERNADKSRIRPQDVVRP